MDDLSMYDSLPVGVYRRTAGPDGRFVVANRALLSMFGFPSLSDLRDTSVSALYCEANDRDLVQETMLKDGEVVRKELRMKHCDGSTLWVAVTARVVMDESGAPTYFDGIMEDITPRRRAEEALAESRRQLVQADKMASLGVLVSGVAHEINNPNHLIVSHLAPLRNVWRDALPILDAYFERNGDFLLGGRPFSQRRSEIPDMFGTIEGGARRIRTIVQELREYARERPPGEREPVRINSVVKSALALLSNLLKKSTRRVDVTYGSDIPVLDGSYQRIEQVVINLVQNACQALPGPTSRIGVETSYDRAGGQVVVEVSDEGCGIRAEDLPHITDPFFTTKRGRGGTGLGLAISSGIISEHGGRLTFESVAGEGTMARVLLPVDREDG